MDYNYQIHDSDINIKDSFNNIHIFFVLSGHVSFYDKAYLGKFQKHEFFILEPYTSPNLLINSGKVIALTINKLSFNRFSLFGWDQLYLDKSKIEHFIKREFLETVIAIYEKDQFNADICIIKLINYIRLGQYFKENTLENANPLVKKVLDYVNNHYKEDLSLAEIADNFFVNASYLSRVFSESMNISLIKYIRKIKIYRLAVEMLTSNYNDKWKEYGYRSHSTFLKNFHRVFNMSPDEFIKKYKTTQPYKESFPNELYLHLKELATQYAID